MRDTSGLITLSDYMEALKIYMNFLYVVGKHKDITDRVKFQVQNNENFLTVKNDYECIA